MSNITRTTTRSWGSRIGGSFKGLLFAPILIIIGIVVLFMNEKRAVKTARGLAEGAASVVSVDSASVDPANEGKLVHFIAATTTTDTLQDDLFGVEAQGLKLRRLVEMYQWEQQSTSKTEKKIGGSEETVTEYSYRKVWSSRPIDSSRFEKPGPHQNPGEFPLQERTVIAEPVQAGAFRLPGRMIESLGGWQSLRAQGDGSTQTAAAPAAEVAQAEPTPPAVDLDDALGLGLGLGDDTEQQSQPEQASPSAEPAAGGDSEYVAHDGGFYRGANPSTPAIGDVRVRFEWVPLGTVSVIARQLGDTLEPYSTAVGTTINMITLGEQSAQLMFEQAEAANRMLTWILRAVGFVVILIGFNMLFGPLGVLADVLPILGRIARMGTGLVSFLLAAPLALVTIAIAWLAARPVMAVVLLVLAAVIALGLLRLRKGRGAEPVAA